MEDDNLIDMGDAGNIDFNPHPHMEDDDVVPFALGVDIVFQSTSSHGG